MSPKGLCCKSTSSRYGPEVPCTPQSGGGDEGDLGTAKDPWAGPWPAPPPLGGAAKG